MQKAEESIIEKFPSQMAVPWLKEYFSQLSLEVAITTINSLPSLDEVFIWKCCVKWAKERVKPEKEGEKKKENVNEQKSSNASSTSRKRSKPGNDEQHLPASKKLRISEGEKVNIFG